MAKKKTTKKNLRAEAIRVGNRFGKTQSAAFEEAAQEACAAGRAQYIAALAPAPEPTLYDQRNRLVTDIKHNLNEADFLSQRLTSVRLDLANDRNRLADVNRELLAELTLDQTR